MPWLWFGIICCCWFICCPFGLCFWIITLLLPTLLFEDFLLFLLSLLSLFSSFIICFLSSTLFPFMPCWFWIFISDLFILILFILFISKPSLSSLILPFRFGLVESCKFLSLKFIPELFLSLIKFIFSLLLSSFFLFSSITAKLTIPCCLLFSFQLLLFEPIKCEPLSLFW